MLLLSTPAAMCSPGDDRGEFFRSSDSGDTWVPVFQGSQYRSSLAINDIGWIFIGSWWPEGGNSAVRSTDNGETWNTTGLGFFDDLASNRSGTVFATGDSGVSRSTDNGATWTRISMHRRGPLTIDASGHIFAGGPGIFRSTDEGSDWEQVSHDSLPIGVYALAITPGGGIFAGRNPFPPVVRSSDNGTSWTAASTGLPMNSSIQTLVARGANLLAGTDSGFYLSTNNGISWTAANNGLPPNITVFAIALSGSTLFAGTQSGVWRRPLFELITSTHGESSTPLPTSFVLFQNYPNPFNPSTTVRYGLQDRVHVTLTVYNALGQIVAKLLNGEQEAGYHEAKFDASGLASGVYFYRLQAGINVDTKRLMLLR